MTVDEQDLESAAIERRQEQPPQGEEAGQANRVGALIHRVELVHADAAEQEQPEREDGAALDDEEQRDGDRGNRRHQAHAQIGALFGVEAPSAAARGAAARASLPCGSARLLASAAG